MTLPERDYYPLQDAASMIGCKVDDLINWAANGKTRLGVLFHMDGFEPKRYHWMDGETSVRKIKEFHGFAYVDRLYFAHFERRGEFAFNAVKMLDGSDVFMRDEIALRDPNGIYMHLSELNSLRSKVGKSTKTLFHKDLCKREFGSAVLHVKSLMKWVDDKGLHICTVPDLNDYDMAQVESVLCAIERSAMQKDTEIAAAIVATNPILANNQAAEVSHAWLVGAEAHQQWRKAISEAIAKGELQLLDGISLLPIAPTCLTGRDEDAASDLLNLSNKTDSVTTVMEHKITNRAHVSNNLAILNQAAAKFWANADRNDRTTHPSKTDVVAWLIERGFSQKLADSGATIVRPEWAPTGRKSEE